jgi:hypothetical protein
MKSHPPREKTRSLANIVNPYKLASMYPAAGENNLAFLLSFCYSKTHPLKRHGGFCIGRVAFSKDNQNQKANQNEEVVP